MRGSTAGHVCVCGGGGRGGELRRGTKNINKIDLYFQHYIPVYNI